MSVHLIIGLGYFLAAATSLAAWHRSGRQTSCAASSIPTFWLAAGALLITMGIARSTSAANNAGDAARRLAESEGWYDDRRPAQLAVVLTLIALWTWAISLVVRHGRGGPGVRRSATLIVVLTSLFLLGALRTISFHYFDSVLDHTILGGPTDANMLEITGIVAAIALAAGEIAESGDD